MGREGSQDQLAPAVEPPPRPEGEPPARTAKRPAGLRAIIDAFDNRQLDLQALSAFDRPVYFALGGRSNPDLYARVAKRLAGIFRTSLWRRSQTATTSDPSHRIEAERLAASLVALWRRAET
jgi:hypothetical protein